MSAFRWWLRTDNRAFGLRPADLAPELVDLAAPLLGLGAPRLVGAGADADDIVRHVLGALRRLLGAAGNLLRGRALFLDGSRNRGRYLVDLGNDGTDALDGVDGLARDLLDVGDLFRDVVGCLGGLARQRFDLGDY